MEWYNIAQEGQVMESDRKRGSRAAHKQSQSWRWTETIPQQSGKLVIYSAIRVIEPNWAAALAVGLLCRAPFIHILSINFRIEFIIWFNNLNQNFFTAFFLTFWNCNKNYFPWNAQLILCLNLSAHWDNCLDVMRSSEIQQQLKQALYTANSYIWGLFS